MRRVIINVPEQRYEEFLNAMNGLGFIPAEEDFEIPEWHKEIVRESIRNTKEEDYIPFEVIKTKYGFK